MELRSATLDEINQTVAEQTQNAVYRPIVDAFLRSGDQAAEVIPPEGNVSSAVNRANYFKKHIRERRQRGETVDIWVAVRGEKVFLYRLNTSANGKKK